MALCKGVFTESHRYYKPAMIVLQLVETNKSFKCGFNDDGRRLDRIIKKLMPNLPAGRIYSGIRKGLIRVNAAKVQQNYRTIKDDLIEISSKIDIDANPVYNLKNNESSIRKIERFTIFRNDNIILLNKPGGMLTHGKNSLAEILKQGIILQESLSFTPAPLHRLDRNTSGLIAASISLRGAQHFTELIRLRKIKKFYLGLCKGELKTSLNLVSNLSRDKNKTFTTSSEQGSKAITFVKPILIQKDFTLCLFRIETGITHQIRSQIAEAGHPLAGDKKYGGQSDGFRKYYLHSLALTLPDSVEICGFQYASAPIPEGFNHKIIEIFKLAYTDIFESITSLIN